jgi:hypothetical protein
MFYLVVQRIVIDYTSYMTRVRAKFKMDGENPGPGLPGHRDFTNSYMNTRTWGITRDRQVVTTYCLPLNHGAPSYSKVPVYPSTTPIYKETTHIP